VLLAVPGSRLVLLAPAGSARACCLATFASAGVDAARIEFVGYMPRARYLKVYDRIDICLDTSPYCGHTTSLDSWWMRVPVLTLPGSTVASRADLAYASNLGLRSWVASDADDYVERARGFACRLGELAELRAGLRQRMEASPLMDARRFARHLEAAYREMWRAYCAR